MEGANIAISESCVRVLLQTIEKYGRNLQEDQWDWGAILQKSGLGEQGLTRNQIRLKFDQIKQTRAAISSKKKLPAKLQIDAKPSVVVPQEKVFHRVAPSEDDIVCEKKRDTSAENHGKYSDKSKCEANHSLTVTPRRTNKRVVPKKIQETDVDETELTKKSRTSPLSETFEHDETTNQCTLKNTTVEKTVVLPHVRERRKPGPATELSDDLARIMSGNNYGLMFKSRIFSVTEWQRVLDRVFTWKYTTLVDLAAKDWKELFDDVEIPTSKSGEEIMQDFYTYAVPNIRSIESFGKKTRIDLCETDRFTHMAIYHRLDTASLSCLDTCVQDMVIEEVLGKTLSTKEWKISFLTVLLTRDETYFNTFKQDFDSVKKSFLDELISHC